MTDDHIITLGNSRHAVNAEQWAKTRLENHWDATNTNSRTPRVLLSYDAKGTDFRQRDYIVIYETAATSEPVTVTHQYTNESTTLSLDFYTAQSRDHLVRLIEEARRVLLAARNDTFEAPGGKLTGRTWLQWGTGISPYSNTSTGYHRRVVDVEIRWRYRSIEVNTDDA